MTRLSEVQRRVMAYLMQEHGNRIETNGKSYAIVVPNSEWSVGPRVDYRTLNALFDLDLVEQDERNRWVPTAKAWALAHKGQLR